MLTFEKIGPNLYEIKDGLVAVAFIGRGSKDWYIDPILPLNVPKTVQYSKRTIAFEVFCSIYEKQVPIISFVRETYRRAVLEKRITTLKELFGFRAKNLIANTDEDWAQILQVTLRDFLELSQDVLIIKTKHLRLLANYLQVGLLEIGILVENQLRKEGYDLDAGRS